MKGPYLEVLMGTAKIDFQLDQTRTTIGRHAANSLVISDARASRSHCVIERVDDGGFQVRDLNSSNGTRLNGELIHTAPFEPGDIISIGATTMKLIVPGQNNNGNAADMLTEADLADEDADLVPISNEFAQHDGGMMHVANDVDYERALQTLSDSLPDHSFGEYEIALLNSRGVSMHDAGAKPIEEGGRRQAVDLFRLLLLVCFRSRTTDIHLEPRQDFYQARLRIDGTMVDVARMPHQVGHRLATLIKVLSDLDIAHKNVIQEGHFAARIPAKSGVPRRVDYRVSFAPSVYGQKCVIRVLDTSNAPLRAADLNLPRWMLQEIAEAIKQDAGMILVSGPTGSGKTTSLYSLIRSIEVGRRNVVTIEDPVEIQLEGVTQIPVSNEQEKSFPQLLRSVLRQDPDVILVGEVRDAETARVAMQAAITGHLVFSTVHTKDTIGTIFRLLDLGVEPYLVAQGLHIVLAQRLVRQLCQYCKRAVEVTPEQKQAMGLIGEAVTKIYNPAGCPRCLGTGFSGRRAFFELLRVTDDLRDIILKAPTTSDIQNVLARQQFQGLQQSGYQLVAEGVVAFGEIERAVGRERA
jgi:general secretion pathway protein E